MATQREDREKWQWEGFVYHREKKPYQQKDGVVVNYVKCVRDKKGCKAREKFINNKYTQISEKGHNHFGNENLPVKDRMLDNLKKYSSVPFLTPSQIYESAVLNDTKAAELYPYPKQRSTIKYLRSKSQPNLVHLLKHDKTLHGFWQSLVAGNLNGQLKYGEKKEFELTIHLENLPTKKYETATNLFIYDHDLLESVSRDHIDIHVDATFRCPPHFIDSSVQFLTVMVKIKNVSTHFDKLHQEKISNIHTTVIHVRFREGPSQCDQTYFFEIMPRHCYFHYAQALFRKAKKFGLISKKKNKRIVPEIFIVLHLIKLLAVLPAQLIMKVYDLVKRKAEETHGATFIKFFSYFESYWLFKIKPESFTVYGMLSDRTNNHQESFHRDMNKLVAAHSHTNVFINGLKKVF